EFVERHLKDMEVLVTKKYENGDIEYVELGDDPNKTSRVEVQNKKTIQKDEYIRMAEPDWARYFHPEFSFINMVDEDKKITDKKVLLWSNEEGGFVSYTMKYDATFQEPLELQRFPLDGQLCRIKVTAEMPIETFQFVPLKSWAKKVSQVCDMWAIDTSIQEKCTVYVRHCDREFPFEVQRSCFNILLHCQRRGDYYFHSVLVMVFLVNIISLCAFFIPLDDTSGRLGHLSTCFLAVLAYRYVIGDSLPRKQYLTAADIYIIFACSFQVIICLETVWVGYFFQSEEELADVSRKYEIIDDSIGFGLLLVWLATNALLYMKSRFSHVNWTSVYNKNTEPYAPIIECKNCGEQWVSKQCEHGNPKKICPWCESANVRTIYYTPGDRPPLVKPQQLPQVPAPLKKASIGNSGQPVPKAGSWIIKHA
ncbi:Glra2, partial [Symbiodinium pilosum]